MQDERKNKKQLVRELRTLSAKLKRLEKSEEKRERLVDELRESKERYHSVVDNSDDAILLTAPDGRVFSANPAACRMFGRTEKDICRLGRNGVVDTTDSRLQKDLQEREDTGRFKGELTLTRKNGARFPAEISSTVFLDSRHRQRSSMIVRDLTERYRAEEALRESEERFRAIADYTHDVEAWFGLDGRLLWINSSVEHMMSYSVAECLMMLDFPLPLIHPEDRAKVIAEFGDAKRGGSGDSAEFRFIRKDGEVRWGSVSWQPIFNRDGQPMGHRSSVRDITEKKLAELAIRRAAEVLRENEARLRAVLDNLPFDLWARDSEDRCTLLNRTAIRHWGNQIGKLTEEAGIGAAVVAMWKRLNKRALAGEVVREETEFIHDGAKGYYYTIVAPIQGENQILGTLGFNIDITERKYAEEAVVLLAHAIRGISECVSVTDQENKILFVNDAFLKTYGYTRDELLGKSISIVRSRTSEPATDEVLRATLQGGWQGELVNRKKDGTEFPITLSTSIVRDDKGRALGLVGIAADITERKRAEEALAESERKLRTLFEILPVGISVHNAQRKVVYENPALQRILDFSSEDLLTAKHTTRTYLRPDGTLMPTEEFASVRAIKEQRAVHNVETGVVKEDGTVIWTTVSAVPLGFPDWEVLVVSSDITERKRAEERLIAAKEQLRKLAGHLQGVREEERKHLSQEFHDQLGQMLTALKMDLAMLQRELADKTREVSLSTVGEKLQSMQGLIDSGTQAIREIMSELHPELLDQLGLVAALEWEAERFQNRSGVKCLFTSDPGEVQFDPKESIALFRIFQEAVTNVARHSHATATEISVRREKGDVILEIKDNGIGIESNAETKAHSFGLIGMRERAILLGGRLEITGIKGRGTTVLVRMPYGSRHADEGDAS